MIQNHKSHCTGYLRAPPDEREPKVAYCKNLYFNGPNSICLRSREGCWCRAMMIPCRGA